VSHLEFAHNTNLPLALATIATIGVHDSHGIGTANYPPCPTNCSNARQLGMVSRLVDLLAVSRSRGVISA
jgi:hypothetical protein